MKRRLSAGLALLALALAAPSAGAEPVPSNLTPFVSGSLLTQVGQPVRPAPFVSSGFRLRAGRFRVHVFTYGSAVVLTAARGHLGESAYLARGVAKPKRMRATFGDLGLVSMRFHQLRPASRGGRGKGCEGRSKFIYRRGVFLGDLRFRGESGYVSVHAHRAKGAIETLAPECRPRRRRRRSGGGSRRSSRSSDGHRGHSSGGGSQVGFLRATWREATDSTAFLFLGSPKRSIALAVHEESRGPLGILRVATVRGRSPLSVNEAVTSAEVAPGYPFHGTGHYEANDEGATSWSGDLSVDFPGSPRFPLTGPQFETTITIPF